jgi:16S rRNA (adenine1518-N6/adenine1519-N6)-dimethyltransferase
VTVLEAQSISALLKKYDLRPRKGLGQNFLIDSFHLAKIVEAAELTPTDTVLEIGPGPGTLTRLLAASAGRVIAVELDPNMINLLQTEYRQLNNLTLIEADILTINPNDLLEQINNDNKSQISNLKSQIPTPYKVVANLPYYITSAVLRHVLEVEPRPARLVVTVQKEVADRIVARPDRMSVLAVSVQYYGQPSLVHRIPAGAFYPPPKVDSAVVRIDTFAQPAVTGVESEHFFRVVKAGFGQKRKQLKNSLTAGLGRPASTIIEAMTRAQITPTRRAETLTLAEWGRLAEALR